MQKPSWTFSKIRDFSEIAPHVPDWFLPIGTMIQKERENKIVWNERELAFRIMTLPKPLQHHLLGFLQTDYISQANAYLAAPRRMSPGKIINRALNAHRYMDEHTDGIRNINTLPMTRAEAIDAMEKFGTDLTVQRTAAALQVCLNQYTDALTEQLVRHYGFAESSEAIGMLSVAKNSEAIWADFSPFLSLKASPDDSPSSPFAAAFKTALANQAFQSQRGHAVKICPGQSLVKHFTKTDVIEQADGSFAIADTPKDGALPAFIYRKLQERAIAPNRHMFQTPG